MKQLSTAFILALFVPVLFLTTGCKKNKTSQVYFSASSANVNSNGTATVTVALSQPSDNPVVVGFQSIGTSKIDFGTTGSSFMHDDSDKLQATIDANGYIDSAGFLEIIPGATGVVISFVQKGDDFPHAAANFEIKMVSATNASIRQGSNTYTYNVSSSSVTEQFASTITFTDTVSSEAYTLSNYSYTPSGNNYNLVLDYTPVSGVTTGPLSIELAFSNMPAFTLGTDTLSCTNTTISDTINYANSIIVLNCNNFTSSKAVVALMNAPMGSVYGNYFVFNNGTAPAQNLVVATPYYQITGSLSSPFIDYIP